MPLPLATPSTPIVLVADDDRLARTLRALLTTDHRFELVGCQHSLDELFAQSPPPEAIIIVTILLTSSGVRPWRSHAGYDATMRRAILVAPYPTSAGARIADACGIGAFVAHEAIPAALVPTITHLADGTAAPLRPSR